MDSLRWKGSKLMGQITMATILTSVSRGVPKVARGETGAGVFHRLPKSLQGSNPLPILSRIPWQISTDQLFDWLKMNV